MRIQSMGDSERVEGDEKGPNTKPQVASISIA